MDSKMSFGQRVINAQNEIKAPKGQYNNFGKYSYRSAEDILEAVKPVLLKYDLYLTLHDEIIAVGDRIYIKAVATLHDTESDKTESVHAFAREPLQNKGMSESQVTGAASSYARKYAMNGLFCLDDTKDADTNEYRNQQQAQQYQQVEAPTYPNQNQIKALIELAKQKGMSERLILKNAKVSKISEITNQKYYWLVEQMRKLPDVQQAHLNL